MSISINIEEKINEISLLSVMVSRDDSAGVQLLNELLNDLIQALTSVDTHTKLLSACRGIANKQPEVKPEQMYDLIQGFISDAQKYCVNPESVSFSTEETNTPSDVSPELDRELLNEFIEKHNSLLDEFEALLISQQFTETEDESINSHAKRYLHTLKGDAASIGLVGCERATHALEDLVVSSGAATCLDQIIEFKEWLTQSLIRIIAEEEPTELSTDFIQRVVAPKKQACLAAPQPQPQTVISKAVEAESNEIHSNSQEPLTTYRLEGDLSLLSEFFAEATDQLNQAEMLLLSDVEEFSDNDLNALFRAVHSIKGGSAYFNLKEIAESSHVTESLMDKARNHEIAFSKELTQTLLQFTGLQRDLFAKGLDACAKNKELTFASETKHYIAQIKAMLDGNNPTQLKAVSKPEPQIVTTETPTIIEAVVQQKKNEPIKQASPEQKRSSEKLDIRSFVKVDTNRLDNLVDTIGEMTIYSTSLIRICRELLPENELIARLSHQISAISRDLQDIGMSMRLDPIKALFQKMSRLVWDTSKKIGKEVALTMDGEDTELDRTLIDRLADPLMHMVRNSVDHGIESPEERARSGKPMTGSILLSASHSGGSIVVKIQDDGKGIDPERILKKAIEKGLVTPEQQLSPQEILSLIFAPGFSTAEQVTDLSGRGVGMDVVRKNIESMRGTVHIDSKVGKGTTFTIEIPLTLAIIDGVEVKVGSEQFVVPTLSIIELLKPHDSLITLAKDKAETFHFRDKFLPMYRLSRLFDVPTSVNNPEHGTVIVVEDQGELAALLVDSIVGQFQAVIKNLGKMFEQERGIAGCAIMPSGNAALILDVRTLLRTARKQYYLTEQKNSNSTELNKSEAAPF